MAALPQKKKKGTQPRHALFTHKYIHFRIAGSRKPNNANVALLIDVAATAKWKVVKLHPCDFFFLLNGFMLHVQILKLIVKDKPQYLIFCSRRRGE